MVQYNKFYIQSIKGFFCRGGLIMSKVNNRYFFFLVFAISIVAGIFAYSIAAQQVSLPQRVSKLRGEINTIQTSASNFDDRLRTLREWGDDLASRGRFTPQVMPVMFFRALNSGLNQESSRTISSWTQILGFIEDNYGKTGEFKRIDKNQLIAGEFTTLTLEYTVGAIEAKPGGIFRIGQHFMSDGARIQNSNPEGHSFVTFKASRQDVELENTTSNWYSAYGGFRAPEPMPAVRIKTGTLTRGDKITITLGDTTGGSKGFSVQTRDGDNYRFPLEFDPSGNGVFVPVGVVSNVIIGNGPALINAIVPSVAGSGESFSLRLRVEDKYFNPAAFKGGSFTIKLDNKIAGQIKIPAGEVSGRLDGLRIPKEGAYKFQVVDDSGEISCQSNPILIENNPGQRIYWGELHGHSGWEEGTGSVQRYYWYARDVAFLDFASLTGHDAMMIRPAWEDIRRETAKVNQPGRFVAYMGYEWTVGIDNGGHHNVFFKNDKGNYVTAWDAPRLPQLYEKLKAIDAVDNVLVIPHAHQTGNWTYNDAEIERLVEIYSMHGSFEYFGQKFLQRGYRVGLIGASDNHTGHPGYSPAQTSTRGGLAAVYSPTLDRDGIWKGMRDRATYATSGKRMVVKLSVDDKTPGQSTGIGKMPVIRARVLGTAAIDHIDLIHNGQVEYRSDYLNPVDNKPTGIQVMFTSPTETPGDEVKFPLNGVTWQGWIEVSNGTIASIAPLGADHFTDKFVRTDFRRVWFVCKTRGDFDGVMITLTDAPSDTQVKVRITSVKRDEGPQGGKLPYGVSEPAATAADRSLYEYTFKANETASTQGKFEVPQFGFVYARKVNAAGSWDAKFSYRPAKLPAQNDYYYLRVVQVDGEAAWSSPIWVGEPAAKEKK